MTAHCPRCAHVALQETIVGGKLLHAGEVHEVDRQFPHPKTCRDFEREPGSDDEHIDAEQFKSLLIRRMEAEHDRDQNA